jgi:nucleoredoxin
LEHDHTSITVAWKLTEGADFYELQLSADGDEWRTLSDKVKTNVIKKKNLEHGHRYFFRVRYLAVGSTEWSPFSESTDGLLVAHPLVRITDPPSLKTRDLSSITIEWTKLPDVEGYKIRFRTESDPCWEYIDAVIKNNVAKKKGLLPGVQYYFSVLALTPDNTYGYSLSSQPMTVATISQFYVSVLPRNLLSNTAKMSNRSAPTGTISMTEALAGKVVAFYFSAHWCGPCRQFTPQLAAMYQQAKAAGRSFEVVFVSADHDEKDFQKYFGENMPWLAVPYDSEQREQLMSMFSVSGIPKLSVLAPSGRIISDNGTGQGMNLATVDGWIAAGARM